MCQVRQPCACVCMYMYLYIIICVVQGQRYSVAVLDWYDCRSSILAKVEGGGGGGVAGFQVVCEAHIQGGKYWGIP